MGIFNKVGNSLTNKSTYCYNMVEIHTYVFLHISSIIWFESLYGVTINSLTMKAEITASVFCKKTRFLPSYFY